MNKYQLMHNLIDSMLFGLGVVYWHLYLHLIKIGSQNKNIMSLDHKWFIKNVFEFNLDRN